MTPLERNFHLWASSGICDLCGNHTSVISDVMTMQRKCLPCLVKENEDRERQKHRVPLDIKGFAEL
jgi:hypothetical protein